MVMPRSFSSCSRSGSMPVSALISVDLPWSTWPAVPMTRKEVLLGRSTADKTNGDSESTQIVANAALGEDVLRLPQWPRRGRARPEGATMPEPVSGTGPAQVRPGIRALGADDVPLLL